MYHNVSYVSSFFFICNILAILKDEQELLILNPSEVCRYIHYTLMYELYVSMYIYIYICNTMYVCITLHMCVCM